MWCVGWVAYYSVADSLVRSELVTGDPDPIWICACYGPDKQAFKNWPMEWSSIRTSSCSEDQTTIRFRNRVISCECLLLSHFLIYRCQYALHVIFIILCDFPSYFTSLITCTGSWDIYDCPLYSCSWHLFVLAVFHVLIVCLCWLRPSSDIPLDCDLTRSIDWLD